MQRIHLEKKGGDPLHTSHHLEGDANGAPHPDPRSYADRFSGKYRRRTIADGVGHNLAREAPRDFAKAVLDVDRL